MKLHVKYFLYIGSLHLVVLAFCLIFLREQPFIFLGVELAMLGSLYLAWRLYRGFVVPIRLLSAGAESLQDQDFSVKFNPVGQRELDALIVVYNRMIDQLRKERARSAERHFFLEKLIEASPGGILLFNLDDKLVQLNAAARRMLRFPKGAVPELPEPFANALHSLALEQPVVVQANGNRYYRCTLSRFIDQGFPRKFVVLEELTEEIVQAEKRAYDKLIRLMAHEVNNSVAAVNALLQTLAQEEADSEMHQAIEVAINRNVRLGQFMENLASVVKLPQPQRQPLDLVQLLRQLIPLAEADCRRYEVSFKAQLPEAPVLLSADASQLEQVLLNALKNAREAAGEGGKVCLQLQAEPASLQIVNDGPAITADIQKKLFTPFFSTKAGGQGIGLMLIREILSNHRFNYQLQTRPDGLTEFSISW